MRAYVLAFTRDQLSAIFPAGTPCTDDPAEALQSARASGAPWILSWCRTYTPLMKNGRTLIPLEGLRAHQILRTENTELHTTRTKDVLRPIDPDLPV